jgi:hypothetical protein
VRVADAPLLLAMLGMMCFCAQSGGGSMSLTCIWSFRLFVLQWFCNAAASMAAMAVFGQWLW